MEDIMGIEADLGMEDGGLNMNAEFGGILVRNQLRFEEVRA